MKRITKTEHNQILVEILTYIDSVCRANNIKYTLAAGSLIGAVRHRGIIPWDDDIDIALMPAEYDKLIAILKKNKNSRYLFMDHTTQKDYFYQFAKLVDTRTTIREKDVQAIENYGVYVDIFRYCFIPDNEKAARRFFRKTDVTKKALALSVKTYSAPHKQLMASLAHIIGYRRILAYRERLLTAYAGGTRVMLNWAAYGYAHEVQSASSFKKYINCQFEGRDVMISAAYDTILRTTFGDYMQLPPKKDRVSHPIENEFWK